MPANQTRFINATDEVIDEISRQEHACLDQYFGWNERCIILGQFMTVNIIGVVHLAYVVEITSTSRTVTPVDAFGISAVCLPRYLFRGVWSIFHDFLRMHRVNHL